MAVKPNIALARWGSDQTNDVAPSSGQRDSGWVSHQVAVSSYMNHITYQLYLWAKYVDEGVFDGDVTIDGNLHVTGDTTVDGDLILSGPPKCQRSVMYSGANAVPLAGSGASTTSAGQLSLSTSVQYATCPIEIGVGETLMGWRVFLNKSSTTGTITAELVRQAADGSQTQIGSSQTNGASAPGAVSLGAITSAEPETVAGECWFVRVAGGGTVTGGVPDIIASYLALTEYEV